LEGVEIHCKEIMCDSTDGIELIQIGCSGPHVTERSRSTEIEEYVGQLSDCAFFKKGVVSCSCATECVKFVANINIS
jgi:hypothetical protein